MPEKSPPQQTDPDYGAFLKSLGVDSTQESRVKHVRRASDNLLTLATGMNIAGLTSNEVVAVFACATYQITLAAREGNLRATAEIFEELARIIAEGENPNA